MLVKQFGKAVWYFTPGFLIRLVGVLTMIVVGMTLGMIITSLFVPSVATNSAGTPFFQQSVTWGDVYIMLATWIVITIWKALHEATHVRFRASLFYFRMLRAGRVVKEHWETNAKGTRTLHMEGVIVDTEGNEIPVPNVSQAPSKE